MSNRKVSIFFIPHDFGGMVALLAVFILIPLLLLQWVIQFFVSLPFVQPIASAYSSLMTIILLYISPVDLATAFGSKTMTEVQIQEYFDTAIKTVADTQNIHFVLIYAAIALLVILIIFGKYNPRKNTVNLIARVFAINYFVSIPLWEYITQTVFTMDTNALVGADYGVIFDSMQHHVRVTFLLLAVISIVVTGIVQVMISRIGPKKTADSEVF